MSIEKLLREIIEDKKKTGGIKNVMWIAAGGSFGGFYPAHYLMEHEGKAIKSSMYTSNEFVYAPPVSCNGNTIAVICSMRGTAETCVAAQVAKDRGATTIGLYVEESKLTETCEYNIRYSSIAVDESKTEEVNSSIGLNIAFTFLYLLEGYKHYADAQKAFEIVDDIYRKAVEYATPLAQKWAKANKDEKTIYVMGGGPAMGSAYIFSICNLMEMQWIDSPTVNTCEFFHGPFESLDKNLSVFLLVSEGRTRPADLRAEQFLKEYGGHKIYVLDAKELGLNRIKDTVVEYFNHIIFSPILNNVYLRQLSYVREHDYLNRRYMWKVAY